MKDLISMYATATVRLAVLGFLVLALSLRGKAQNTNFDFQAALMAADKVIKDNPSVAQDRIVQGVDGQVTLDQLKAVWPQYDFECRLDHNLVDLMTLEGSWIAQRGMIKDVAVSKQFFQGFVDDAPLKALAPARVSFH